MTTDLSNSRNLVQGNCGKLNAKRNRRLASRTELVNVKIPLPILCSKDRINKMSAIKKIFNEIVDYAGLFPPAKLPLENVVSNYASYQERDDAWMLARLIVPAGRLSELQEHQPFLNSQRLWKISALIPSVDAAENGFETSINTIDEFNQRFAGKAIVDTVEVKTLNAELVDKTIEAMPNWLNAFFEIPHRDDPSELIGKVAAAPEYIFAKIRTGGVTEDLIPTPQEVARFISRCGELNAGFKATAGLHHPLRGDYRLSYEPDAQLGTMFGFVNIFVAACFAFSGHSDSDLIQRILIASNSNQFEFLENELLFDGHSVSIDQIVDIRSNKAISFGSCSFDEPTIELFELKWSAAANS